MTKAKLEHLENDTYARFRFNIQAADNPKALERLQELVDAWDPARLTIVTQSDQIVSGEIIVPVQGFDDFNHDFEEFTQNL